MIPGSNILNMAFKLIARQTFKYSEFIDRTVQPNGQYVSNYKTEICITGSAQPVPRNLFQEYGLDFQRNYYNFFVARDILDVGRDVAGDQVVFQGMYFQVLSRTPWFGVDGWDQILTVQVINPDA